MSTTPNTPVENIAANATAETTAAMKRALRRGKALAALMLTASTPHVLDEMHYAVTMMRHPESDFATVMTMSVYAAELARIVSANTARDLNAFHLAVGS